jgi:uncharacterized flavoprotein (TIGR03862 family)
METVGVSDRRQHQVAVIGAGPAGLMAAEVLAAAGVSVTVYERMPSPGRKLLMAGRGGLNLTHSEPADAFTARYGDRAAWLMPLLEAFPPSALRAWAEALGQPTFVGSSGRVFPKAMKASPLLRAWLRRLAGHGVVLKTRHDWLGWDDTGDLLFRSDGETVRARADAVVLALGGASWPRLGSNGRWADTLSRRHIAIAPFQPANCGFTVAWSEPFRARFAGSPLKGIALGFASRTIRGEAVITSYGIEGGAVYALSAALRDALGAGDAVLEVDLRPELSVGAIERRLRRSSPGQSLSNVLRKALKLSPVAANLLREAGPLPADPAAMAARIKSMPLRLTGTQPIERAISTAGGIHLDALDDRLMVRALPGVFAAGEMLDWEAPTGGYLIQASFATGVAAAKGVLSYLENAD